MQLSNYSFSSGLRVAGVVVFLCLLVMAKPPDTQITGRVTGANGVPVPDVTVTIKNQESGVVQEVTTDKFGIFKASVSPGVYQITVNLPGDGAKISDVTVALGESKSINFVTKSDEPLQHIGGEAAPPPPKPTAAAAPPVGFARAELTWNAWAEPVSRTPSFSPVPFLEPKDKSYSLILDLAALAYGNGPDVFHQAAGDALKDWVLKSNAPNVDLTLLIIPDKRFFKTTEQIATLPIDLNRLRQAFKN